MPYLPIDFDGKRKAALIATALGAHPGTISWGLQELWEHVWRNREAQRPDVVSSLFISGCFGSDPRIPPALVEGGFLEPQEGGTYRVRGAKKWLLGLEGKSRGGKAASSNLIPGARQKKAAGMLSRQDSAAEKSAESPKVPLSASAESQPRASRDPLSAEHSALSSSIQHPASSIREDLFGADAPPPAKPAKKPKPEKPTNPRHAPMVKRLEAVFVEVRGGPYRFDGGNDAKALTELLAKEPDDAEIERRYRIGLQWRGFPACHGIRDLNTHFNAYAAPQGAGPPALRRPVDVTRGTVRAETQDHGTHTGEVATDAV